MHTSASFYTMIITTFTLGVDSSFQKRVRHMDTLRFKSGHPAEYFVPSINEFDLYPNVEAAMHTTEKLNISQICKYYRINKNKFNRYFRYNAYIFAFTSDDTVEVYETTNRDGTVRTKLYTVINTENVKYLYIGFNQSIGCIIGTEFNSIYHLLRGYGSFIYKISTHHLGGCGYSFDDWNLIQRDEKLRFEENLDQKYYYDINDALKVMLQNNPEDFYDYCMRLIIYEKYLIDIDGNIVDVYWSNIRARKSLKDFFNPTHVAEMLSMKYPIYWERTDG